MTRENKTYRVRNLQDDNNSFDVVAWDQEEAMYEALRRLGYEVTIPEKENKDENR